MALDERGNKISFDLVNDEIGGCRPQRGFRTFCDGHQDCRYRGEKRSEVREE